ncbi:hypothetical protein MRBLPE1_002991 [Paenibacillus sp. LPE1-1-1.1]
MRESHVNDRKLKHCRSYEYASYIFEAIETNNPFMIGANVMKNCRRQLE